MDGARHFGSGGNSRASPQALVNRRLAVDRKRPKSLRTAVVGRHRTLVLYGKGLAPREPNVCRAPLDAPAAWARRAPEPAVNRRSAIGRLTWVLLVTPIALASAGCFLAPWSPPRPDPAGSVSGPAPYVEGCQTCHAAPVGAHYAQSLHTAKGIRCGQCHTPGDHPKFTQPIRDGKCGGCHQPQYQETLASKHFATRDQRALDDDRAARTALRREGFIAATAGGRRFRGDPPSGGAWGALGAAGSFVDHPRCPGPAEP